MPFLRFDREIRRIICTTNAIVISSPDLGVFTVATAGVLCAFSCVVDALPEQCLRRRLGTNSLVAAVFRTKRLLREHCSATCLCRRCPGQARRRQGRLQITIESINARLRRAVNARGHFPTEQAALKCLYLALMSLDPTGKGRQRWTNRWKAALNAFDITFDGRLSAGRK